MTQVLLDKKAVDVVKEVVGGGSGSVYRISIYCEVNGYRGQLYTVVNDNSLETYDDLVDYLLDKGVIEENVETSPFYPCSGSAISVGSCLGLRLSFVDSGDDSYYMVKAFMDTNNSYDISYDAYDKDFSITYLTNE